MKSTVETKICELVKSGHERAKELHCAESAALVSDLATQLDVQLVRSNVLAAKLSMINGLMDAAEQANKLAQEATKKLVQERDALATENAGLKKFIAESCFVQAGEVPSWHQAIDHVPETPATEAFLAEVRAQGVEMFAEKCTEKSKHAISSDTRDSWWLCGEHAGDFAAQLRKGVQS